MRIQRGTRGDDALVGTEKRDFILARAGNDTVSGLGAADFLFGQRGNDTLNGDDGADNLGWLRGRPPQWRAGPDWLWAGLGADQLFGGEGTTISSRLPTTGRSTCSTAASTRTTAIAPCSGLATRP